jgi:hypothetical protein
MVAGWESQHVVEKGESNSAIQMANGGMRDEAARVSSNVIQKKTQFVIHVRTDFLDRVGGCKFHSPENSHEKITTTHNRYLMRTQPYPMRTHALHRPPDRGDKEVRPTREES